MSKSRTQKGITLIALIITIVVLLILAVVAIGAVQNDGIINHAKDARDQYGKAQDEENTTLEGYLDKLDKIQANLPGNNGGGNNQGGADTTPATTIAEAQADAMLTKTVNSDVTDKYSNKITVPAGFKILVDDTTGYTAETIDVTKGIVIQDVDGNEFVWVPVGTIYINTEKTESKTITLGRYSDFRANDAGEYVPAQEALDYATATAINDFTEDTIVNHNEDLGNAIAEDLGGFITSATTKGGYYLARYEAGITNYDSSKTVTENSDNDNWTGYVAEEGKELKLVSKKDVQVWNYVTQKKSSELSRNMYSGKPFKSDLVNSYAWDTAIVFIQTFSTEEDASNYANLNKSKSFANTGINADKYCNIHDMSGNDFEWSTETCSRASYPCAFRGGYCAANGFAYGCPSYRNGGRLEASSSGHAFRPLLYVAL